MIKTFTEHLKYEKLNPVNLNISTLKYNALIWFKNWMLALEKMRTKIFSEITIPVITGRAGSDVENWKLYVDFKKKIERLKAEDFIEQLDAYFIRLNNMLQKKAEHYLCSHPISGNEVSYPYPQREHGLGVKVFCRVRIGNTIEMFRTEEQSDTGSHTTAGKDYISSNSKRTKEWLQPTTNTMNFQGNYAEIFDLSSPHAETLWMIKNGHDLVTFLKEKEWKNKFFSDHFPLSYLVGNRVEFVIKSSPCDCCKNYFIFLRKLFDENGINLPIIIFSNRHTNTGLPDCAIFTVNSRHEYVLLPAQWDGDLRERNTSAVTTFTFDSNNLNADYQAVLILSVFGDALLPRLANLSPSIIFTFINSLLDHSSTSFLMVDWTRNYVRKVLTLLPFDCVNTVAQKTTTNSELYKTIDYRFLLEYDNTPGLLEYTKNLAALTSRHPDNAIVFFLCLCKQWDNMIIDFLTDGEKKNINELTISSELSQHVGTVRNATSWDIDSAPNIAKRTHTLFGEPSVSIWNDQLNPLWQLTSNTGNYLHFISVPSEFQRNILNALFTHPDSSPLNSFSNKKNIDFNDADLTIFIEVTLQAIKKMAFLQRKWNTAIIERIFTAFDNKIFDPELLAIIESDIKTRKTKQLSTLVRVFSIEQAKLGNNEQILAFPEEVNDTSHDSWSSGKLACPAYL